MTRSTIKPEPLRLWRVEVTDEGLRLHLSAHWNVTQITVEDGMGSRQEWQYDEIRFTVPYEGARDGVEAWLVSQEARILLIAKTLWEAKHNAVALTVDESKQIVDLATGQIIDNAIHPAAGTDESIGILRNQMVQWGNSLGLEFTLDFKKFNEIAIAAIKAGAARKAEL